MAAGHPLPSRKRDCDLRLGIGGVELVERGLDGVALAGHVEFGEEGEGVCLTLREWNGKDAAPRLVVYGRP